MLLPKDCGHCTGLLLPSSDDPGERVCTECSRSTFTPTAAIVEERPQTMKMEHVIFRSLYPDSFKTQGQGKRDRGIPEARFNAAIRKFGR